MPLGVLNNISAIYAENNLNETQASLQNTLTQLSSGSRINSGADDPAGLAIANGLQANSAALMQSSSNASEGVGFLQVADGALSQVTSLLTSAVTLATEAGGGTLSSSQMSAANQEYQDILSQIGTIGSTTEYNGIQVFSNDQTTSALTWGANAVGVASSATGSSAAIAAGAITAGGATATAAPAATNVNFSNGSTVTANITSGDNLSGSVTIQGTIPDHPPVPTTFSWSSSLGVYTATVANGDNLSGGFTITSTGGTDPATVNVDLTGKNTGNLVSTINTALGANAADYSVAYNSTTGALTIGVNGSPSSGLTAVSVANTVGGVGAATGSTVDVPSSTVASKTLTFDNVTTANLAATLNAQLAGSDYQAAYNSSTGALTFSNSAAGTTAGVTSIAVAGTPTVQQQTPASTTTGSTAPVALTNVTTANLQSVVNTALNGSRTTTADYAVSYSNGTLTVGLTNYGMTTDHIASVATSGALTETTPNAATIAFTDGEQLSGKFTITPTISGAAATGSGITTVNLNGINTSNLVATVNAALGASASNYTVGYNVSQGVGTLSIAVNATGLAANYDSVAIANGLSANAMGESGVAVTNINSANTVMGNFTVTPTTAAGAGSAINVNLQNVTNANLLSTVQSALGANYTVSYNTTAATQALGLGNLSISVSSAGAASGITSFTVAEAASQGASQQSEVAGGVNIYTGDGTSTGSKNYNVTVGALSDAAVGSSAASSNMGLDVTATVGGVTGIGGVLSGASLGTSLTGTTLTSQADAEAALQTVDDAINAVAYQRGQVGANINTLNAASNIASSQQTNITSAENTITATDYAAATSNMSKYEILTQTGISALAQANSTQQMVTKLLQ